MADSDTHSSARLSNSLCRRELKHVQLPGDTFTRTGLGCSSRVSWGKRSVHGALSNEGTTASYSHNVVRLIAGEDATCERHFIFPHPLSTFTGQSQARGTMFPGVPEKSARWNTITASLVLEPGLIPAAKTRMHSLA